VTDPETTPVDGDPLGHLIRRYARPHSRRFVLGGAGMGPLPDSGRVPALLVGVALDAIFLESTPYSLPLVPDAVIPEETAGQVAFTITLLAAAFVAEAVLSWLGGRISGRRPTGRSTTSASTPSTHSWATRWATSTTARPAT